MKDLNLEQLGVQELNAVEVKETDGGFLRWIATYLITDMIFNPSDTISTASSAASDEIEKIKPEYN